MTKENLKAFLEMAKNDHTLKENLKVAKSQEEVVAIARASGFDFTAEKISELSEEELENVAGGTICLLSNINASFLCAAGW
jgi:predicted ribosomally synthesized peptide with nif11-like leader